MSADPRGYYRILSVAPSASQEQIKQAFRALAKGLARRLPSGQNHPAIWHRKGWKVGDL